MSDNKQNPGKIPHNSHLVYLYITGAVFVVFAIIFLFFPRTKFSELEKRELAEFPVFSIFEGTPAEYTAAISQWFSDSEPYRDHFMTLSMSIRDAMKFYAGGNEEAVSFRPSVEEETQLPNDLVGDEDLEAAGNPLADESMKKASSGILIVGSGPNLRAFSAFGGRPESANKYIEVLNAYAEALPGVNIYSLIAPNAGEFYLPDKAKGSAKPQKPVLDYVQQHLNPRVKFVDAYKYLAAKTNEDIYLRTDHHWAPLAGYYAARAFAKEAQVPFKDLDSYEKKVVHGYVGSMYGYSHDIAVKNSPEDFYYYLPKNVDYTTTYITYTLDKDRNISSESKPYEGKYFHEQKDGSGNAYCTFMGGDRHLVKVKTNTPGNRKLMIIKDSYGNVLPGFLFYSFSEIHVADFRNFARNMKDYVKENGITDLMIANGIFGACTPGNMEKFKKFLTQPNGISRSSASSSKDSSGKKESGKTESKKTSPASEPKKEVKKTEKSSSKPKETEKTPAPKPAEE